jgi:hypothetical protein
VGDYPVKGVDLHYHFAKLQLNSLALRAATAASISNITPERKNYANLAIHSASSVLSVVLDEPSIRDSLIGVPLYIDTMIAFAAVFLLKVTARWKSIEFSPLAPAKVWNQLGRVITLLKEKRAGEHHIIHQVAMGLDKMLMKCIEISNSNSPYDDSRLWEQILHTAQPTIPPPAHTIPPRNAPPYHDVQVYMPESYPSQVQVDTPTQTLYPEVSLYPGDANNEQYFPIHMGMYDFLSPQLPY